MSLSCAGPFTVRGSLEAVLPLNHPTRRARSWIVLAWSSAVLVLLAAGQGCQVLSNTQNSEGVRMFQQAYYQGALQRFQQAIQSDPNNPDAYYNLARTYHQLGKLHNQSTDLQQAESYYHQCLDRDPNKQDCYRGLAVLLVEQNRSGDAFKLMEGWSARNPSLAAPRIELARLHEETGNRDAAKNYLIEAVAVDPANARALAALGKLREDAGETAQAVANYQRALQIDPNQPQVASRAAALSTPATPLPAPPGGTQMVTAPVAPIR